MYKKIKRIKELLILNFMCYAIIYHNKLNIILMLIKSVIIKLTVLFIFYYISYLLIKLLIFYIKIIK